MTSRRSSVSEIVSVKTALRSSERSSAKSRVRLPPVAAKRSDLRPVVSSCAATSSFVAGGERLLLQHLQPGEVGVLRSRAWCQPSSRSFIRSSITESTRAFAA